MTIGKIEFATDETHVIERVLYDEADLLDSGDLEGWIELYTDDGRYWMPVSPDQESPDDHVSLFYDDRLLMEIRRRNFGHPLSASMEHEIRTSHLIGNVRLQESPKADVRVTSNFHATVYTLGEQHVFAGRYTHDLTRDGEGYKIHRKRVDVINCDAALKNIVIYL